MSIVLKSVEPYKETEGKISAIGDEECWSSSSTSSIGRNSDDDDKSSDGGENEVESSYKGGPLDMMESLDEVLPIRRGISKFYNGKSKSFTSLIETTRSSSSSSIKDLTKPENAYSRRRRNIVSHNLWEKTRSGFSVRNNNGCGISKRSSISSSRSTLALAMAMNNNSDDNGSSNSSSSSSIEDSLSPKSRTMMMTLPPLHPQSKGNYGNYAWKSYSVADLPRCSGVVAGGGAMVAGLDG